MKRLVCILLCAAMLSALVSCGSETADDKASITTTAKTAIDETADTRILPDLPDVTYDGCEFRIYQRGKGVSEWQEVCIWANEQNGEPINDAVYKRNLTIMERYNIKIVTVDASGQIVDGPMRRDFRNSVLADDNAFDMAMMGVKDSGILVTEGLYTNLYSVPHIDLSKPWWEKSVNDSLTMLGKLYFAVSCMGINDKDDSFLIMFSKTVASNIGMTENPYELVRNNEWTTDTFWALAKTAVADLDGNSEYDANDRYGYSGFDAEAWSNFFAYGERIARVDSDGYPYFDCFGERTVTAYEKIYRLMTQENVMLNTSNLASNEGMDLHQYTYKIFSNHQVLFAAAAMTVIQKSRAMEQDFGILPYPKLDAEQDKYYTMCGLWGPTAVVIPKTCRDLDRTGVIVEAMVAESMYTVYPAYYDVNLVTKGIRDEESKEMLDIVFNGRGYDLGILFAWGGMVDTLNSSLQSKKDSIVSTFIKLQNRADKEKAATVAEFEKNISAG